MPGPLSGGNLERSLQPALRPSRAAAPQAVINAAAYTAVDRAEEEEALATVINADAPAAMARACAAGGPIRLYFDGLRV